MTEHKNTGAPGVKNANVLKKMLVAIAEPVNLIIIGVFASIFALSAFMTWGIPRPDSRPEARRMENEANALSERKESIIKSYPAFDSVLYHMGKAKQYRDSIKMNNHISYWFTNKEKHDQGQERRLKMMNAHLDSMESILYRRLNAQPPAAQNRQVMLRIRR